MSEQDTTLDEFVGPECSGEPEEGDPDTLEQEQFGPFTLSTPGEWTAKRLGDIKQLITRGKQPTYADDGVPVINQECIYWDGWYFENLRYLDEDVAKNWKEKYFPQKGDVILNSTGQGTLGRAQVYPDEEQRAIDSHVTLLRTDEELSPHFHRYFLESYLGQALLYSMCVNGSTGQIELSKTRLDLLPIPLPPLEEQRKIASVLYTVDEAIQKTKDMIERYRRLYSGVLQSVFDEHPDEDTKKVGRLGDIPVTWDAVALSEVADVTMGNSPKSKYYNSKGDGLPFYQGADEFGERSPTPDRWCSNPKKTAQSDATLLNIRSHTNVGKVNQATHECCIGRGVAAITPRDGIDADFLYHHLRERENYVNAIASGSTFDSVNSKEVKTLKIMLPPIDEQKQIASALNDVQELILQEKRTDEQLNRIKQGLMQDLLSGEVRTTDADIDVLDAVAQHG